MREIRECLVRHKVRSNYGDRIHSLDSARILRYIYATAVTSVTSPFSCRGSGTPVPFMMAYIGTFCTTVSEVIGETVREHHMLHHSGH